MKLPCFGKVVIAVAVFSTASKALAQDGSMAGMQMETEQRGQQTAPHNSGSISRDAMHLQEAEDPTQHTGEDLPAPELLTDAAKHPPIALPQFEDWAEQNNPTLKQAAATRERSEQQSRQAGLPPNPTIGYSGEHIRGGSYHAVKRERSCSKP